MRKRPPKRPSKYDQKPLIWCCFHKRLESRENFRISRKEATGLQTSCREGQREYVREHHHRKYNTDPEFRAAMQKSAKKYRDSAKARKTRQAHFARSRALINKNALRRHHERWATDPIYKLRIILRGGVKKIVRRKNDVQSYRYLKRMQASGVRDLGCSIQQFKEYIEAQFSSGMSWDNHGKVWQLDHVVPLASFDLTDREQLLKACHFSNFQPLLKSDHHLKTLSDYLIIRKQQKE